MPNTARQKILSPVGRWLLVVAIFLATVFAVFFAGSYFAPSYVATALLIGPVTHIQSDAVAPRESPVPESGLVSDEAVLAVDKQIYPNLLTTLAPGWAIARTRSYFSIVRSQDSGSGPEKLRITFANQSRDIALRGTDALASALIQASQTRESNSRADRVPSSVTPSAATSSTRKTSEPQPTAPLLKGPPTLSALRYDLDQLAQQQASLELQLSQQSTQLATIQRERQRLAAGAKDNADPERERQLKKHDADEAALQSQLAAATRTMNDLGERYTADYPEYLNAKDRVEELQTSLNQFQSKPFIYVSSAPGSDNSRHVAELDQQETAVKATLQILQQELDRNHTETKRMQALITSWPRDSMASSPGSVVRTTVTNPAPSPPPGDSHSAPVSGYTIVEDASILSSTPGIDLRILSLISVGFGLITASSAALLTRSPRKIIKSEEDLENELPARIRYLGGIPRIKHEIISR